jgi:tetratricopeptide (TPR) repeat protein
LFQILIWAGAAQAQANPTGAIDYRLGNVKVDSEFQRSVVVTVLNDAKKRLDRQSVVKLHDKKRDNTLWQTTTTDSETTFYGLDFGDYELEVSAVGYLTAHQAVSVFTVGGIAGSNQELRVDVNLQRDPAAVDLSASYDAMPAKARKDVKRAVYDLRSGNLNAAQKQLDRVSNFASSIAQISFLYGYLYWQLKDLDKAETYLGQAAISDPGKEQTLSLLGRVQLQRQHYADAQKSLEQAVAANSGYWMAHNLLADAYLKQKEYDKAREQAQRAIDEGKGAASAAQLVLGEALANVGRDKEGIQALQTFLQNSPSNPAVPQVKELIAKIENRETAGEIAPVSDLALAASIPSLPPSAWGPPGVDDVKPSVAADVACPTQQVLESAGERMKQLVDNITRFAAIEDMVHEQLDQVGNPVTKETRKFDYVASISEEHPGFLSTEEYRSLRYGVADLPDGIATSGFVTLALIFHPDMRENFEMICEGLGEWQGQATWLVHFRQRDDKPSRFADYVVGSTRYPMKLKGRAWIAANNFQIVRIESDLASPVPQLAVQHQIAEYGPVLFQRKNVELWLPQKVDIFIELNRHRYHRRHSFDRYMLFSVNADEKATPPKANEPPASPPQNP